MLAVMEATSEAVLRARAQAALDSAPGVEAWGRDFMARVQIRPRRSVAQLESMVHTACLGIALSCTDDPDARLRELLLGAIAEAESFLAATPERMLQPV